MESTSQSPRPKIYKLPRRADSDKSLYLSRGLIVIAVALIAAFAIPSLWSLRSSDNSGVYKNSRKNQFLENNLQPSAANTSIASSERSWKDDSEAVSETALETASETASEASSEAMAEDFANSDSPDALFKKPAIIVRNNNGQEIGQLVQMPTDIDSNSVIQSKSKKDEKSERELINIINNSN